MLQSEGWITLLATDNVPVHHVVTSNNCDLNGNKQVPLCPLLHP